MPFVAACIRGRMDGGCYCYLGIALRAQLLKKSARLLFLITSAKAPPAASALNQPCKPHTGNGGHSLCLSSSQSLLVGFSIQDGAMEVAQYLLLFKAASPREKHGDVSWVVSTPRLPITHHRRLNTMRKLVRQERVVLFQNCQSLAP